MAYRAKLHASVCRSGLFMQPIVEAAKAERERLVYSDGENGDVLRAVQAVVDEKVAHPVLIGRLDAVEQQIEKIGLRIRPGKDFELFDPQEGRSPRGILATLSRSGWAQRCLCCCSAKTDSY